MTGNASARHGSIVIVVAVAELRMCSWQVVVPRRGRAGAVDHQAAHAADALAAVVVEGDRLLALGVELLVEDVEHLEERHVSGDTSARPGRSTSLPGRFRAVLAPDLQGEVHCQLLVAHL
jgi:hypothetical protein